MALLLQAHAPDHVPPPACGRPSARPPLAQKYEQLIGEKKALERGCHGTRWPPLRGGV